MDSLRRDDRIILVRAFLQWRNEDDQQANEHALTEGTRLFSVYHAASGAKFWIITEADRSATTVLVPEDY